MFMLCLDMLKILGAEDFFFNYRLLNNSFDLCLSARFLNHRGLLSGDSGCSLILFFDNLFVLFYNHWLLYFCYEFLVLLMNDGSVNLLNLFSVDDRLMMLMNNILLRLVNHIFVMLNYDILMVLMDYVSMVFLNYSWSNMRLNSGWNHLSIIDCWEFFSLAKCLLLMPYDLRGGLREILLIHRLVVRFCGKLSGSNALILEQRLIAYKSLSLSLHWNTFALNEVFGLSSLDVILIMMLKHLLFS